MVRFLSASDGWTLFGALACLRRVGPIMTLSPGLLCRLPAMLLQRVRTSWGSSNPESSSMHSGNAPRRLLWLTLLERVLPKPDTRWDGDKINIDQFVQKDVFEQTGALLEQIYNTYGVVNCIFKTESAGNIKRLPTYSICNELTELNN